MRQKLGRAAGAVAIDTLENRRLCSGGGLGIIVPAYPEITGEPIIIGTNKLIDITFTADNNRKTTISVHGAEAAITFVGPALPLLAHGHGYFPNGTVEEVQSILVTDAVPGKASISEVCAYGTGSFNVGSITGGDLGSVNFPDVNLTSSLSMNSVHRLELASVGGATMTVAKAASMVKVTGNVTGSFTAGSIGSFSTSELIQTNISTTGVFNRYSLSIGSINATSGITNSNILSSGNVGSITTAFIQNSTITAAATLPASTPGTYPAYVVPEFSSAFTAAASIRSIRVLPGITSDYFGNSVIAARTIQTASIGQITGGGGIAAHSMGTLIAVGPSGQLDSIAFHLGPKDLHTSTTVRTALTRLAVPFSQGAGLQDNTMFYDFDLNILR
jgi:hypothetical protein